MAMQGLILCSVLACLVTTATAQPAITPENWSPISSNARAVTGRVMFTPTEITFQNGKSLPLASGGQMLFKPEPKGKKVLADMYRVTAPDDAIPLCKGRSATYLIVWKSAAIGKETEPRTLVPFSGPKLNGGSPDDCGRYMYDAGAH